MKPPTIRTTTPELAAERQARVAEMLRGKPAVRVGDLCRRLGVSPASVRRDLADMERRGLVYRVHGGAVGAGGRLNEPLFDDKTALAAAEKQRIARAALPLIQPNDCIFLDGGSTVLALAGLLKDHTGLTVVTNSLRVAQTLSASGPTVVLTGGELRRLSQTFVGTMTEPLLRQLFVDKAFMGTIGLSDRDGLTTTDPREAYTKDLVMRQARRVILLADSSKIDKVSFVRFGDLARVQVVITDAHATAAQLKALKRAGVARIVRV